MKINIEKNLVEFTPENTKETKELEALWRLIVDCVRFNKKLVPIGEYVPQKDNFARFTIEGMADEDKDYVVAYADNDCKCYCQVCNKYVELKQGDQIPPCCGRLMEAVD